ncbi:MAG: hypothetical protein LBU99_01750 [Spirochaetaceae bacterium]|jgi:hypothetical protein|nr:hypothetical protein [Spirochaetaceae bacterium]
MSDAQICSNCGKEIKEEPDVSIGIDGNEKAVFCSMKCFTKRTKAIGLKIKRDVKRRKTEKEG